MTEPGIQIYCDMRETRSGILEQLATLGAKPIVGELETGDYVLSGDLVVERKTAVDFVASILDGRLFNQVGKMRLNFITACIPDRRRRLQHSICDRS